MIAVTDLSITDGSLDAGAGTFTFTVTPERLYPASGEIVVCPFADISTVFVCVGVAGMFVMTVTDESA